MIVQDRWLSEDGQHILYRMNCETHKAEVSDILLWMEETGRILRYDQEESRVYTEADVIVDHMTGEVDGVAFGDAVEDFVREHLISYYGHVEDYVSMVVLNGLHGDAPVAEMLEGLRAGAAEAASRLHVLGVSIAALKNAAGISTARLQSTLRELLDEKESP